ncbi:uncharacterized protein TRIADDRAFT_29944 [Trichoplax adhaerens]|uniref:EF-hand domain-containing protein n=1 Tax=Trichoplax adhaerens TaxID=10228 RepID=B3S5P0_TRIAD|nr:hypothetical protein TRIADDRAFT_29944 [Trichoplax adhaerens]EDV21934.1 hypothetical protein TRIADDRAFT_29944 [Trichoplax adhaerens]|eukprot:XP_002115571.1 hypothetical protein TRIADDRAFT_29944 [Trichoplax adhaerens]
MSPPAPPPSNQQPRSPRLNNKNISRILSTSLQANSIEDATENLTVDSTKIPGFYFPFGKQTSQDQAITDLFSTFPQHTWHSKDFGSVAKACGLPHYLKSSLFNAACDSGANSITMHDFQNFWNRFTSKYHDDISRVFYLLTQDAKDYIEFDDFVPLIQDVIDEHPGLSFLNEAAEFHSHYIKTVIARIYYNVNKTWSYRITLPELRKSNFLIVLRLLEDETDINQITDYFSYEHFYVIYCKFWELDDNHDMLITKEDLYRHNNQALSRKIIDKIFSGAVTTMKSETLTFEEFVWFLISEEDKKHPKSIEYWFRCMDLDGDGYLSTYELEYFYNEQYCRMESLGVEAVKFEDLLCQMIDLVKPKIENTITVRDIKACGLGHIFFNAFVNFSKFMEYEQRDPFADKDLEDEFSDMTFWERYAMNEYELLVAEEGTVEDEYTL